MPPEFMRDIRHTLLWIPENLHTEFLLRGYHPLWRTFPGHLEYFRSRSKRVRNSTSPICFHKGFGLPYTAFDRLY